MKKRSRWNGGATRIRAELMQDAWNRNLIERDTTPTEIDYCDSFRERAGWRHGAKLKTRG